MEMGAGLTMGHRAGRKRAQRGYLVEKIRAKPQQVDRAQSALQPHRRDLPEPLRLSEKAGTVLGRLNLTGFISDQQHEAGQRFQVVVGEYTASIGAPRDGGGAGKGYPCRPGWDAELERMRCFSLTGECECRRRKDAFNEACRALLDAGHRAAVAVSHVAVWDESTPSGYGDCLKRGLTALVRHYGLDQRKRRAA